MGTLTSGVLGNTLGESGEVSPLGESATCAAMLSSMDAAQALRWPLQAAAQTVLALALCAADSAARAQVYIGTDAHGAVVLSNHASDAAPVLLIAVESAPPPQEAAPGATVVAAPAARAAPPALAAEIRAAARRHDIPEPLLAAVVAVESGFDPRAVSPKGAKGLMQLMPETARRFGVKDVFSVRDNLHGGATYLRRLMVLFDDDLSLALAAYNAGEGAVLRAGRRVPPYAETRDYVAKVLAQASRR